MQRNQIEIVELRITVTEMKNSLKEINSRQKKESTNLEDRSTEIIQSGKQEEMSEEK